MQNEEDLGEKERMRWDETRREEKRWFVVGRRRVQTIGCERSLRRAEEDLKTIFLCRNDQRLTTVEDHAALFCDRMKTHRQQLKDGGWKFDHWIFFLHIKYGTMKYRRSFLFTYLEIDLRNIIWWQNPLSLSLSLSLMDSYWQDLPSNPTIY
jgi:hypothetical protein